MSSLNIKTLKLVDLKGTPLHSLRGGMNDLNELNYFRDQKNGNKTSMR